MSNFQNNYHSSCLEHKHIDEQALKNRSINKSHQSLTYINDSNFIASNISKQKETKTVNKFVWVFVLLMSLIVYSLGLTSLSKNIHTITQHILTEWNLPY